MSTRADELWHLDMTSIWVAEHGWCCLMAAVDCCTRGIAGLVARRAARAPWPGVRAGARRGQLGALEPQIVGELQALQSAQGGLRLHSIVTRGHVDAAVGQT